MYTVQKVSLCLKLHGGYKTPQLSATMLHRTFSLCSVPGFEDRMSSEKHCCCPFAIPVTLLGQVMQISCYSGTNNDKDKAD